MAESCVDGWSRPRSGERCWNAACRYAGRGSRSCWISSDRNWGRCRDSDASLRETDGRGQRWKIGDEYWWKSVTGQVLCSDRDVGTYSRIGDRIWCGNRSGIGTFVGVFENNAKELNEYADSWIKSIDKTITGWIQGEEAVQNIEYQESLLDLKKAAEGAGEGLKKLEGTISNLPEVVANKLAQSRISHAIAMGKSSEPMKAAVEASKDAYNASMDRGMLEWSEGLYKIERKKWEFEDKASKLPEGKKRDEQLKGAENAQVEIDKYLMTMDRQMAEMSQINVANQAMQRFDTPKSKVQWDFRGLQTRTSESMECVGNEEEMPRKLQERARR